MCYNNKVFMNYYCEICSKNYKSYNSLYNHKKRYHSGTKETEPLICDYCSQTFTRKYNMDRHIGKCKFKTIDSKPTKNIDSSKLEKLINLIDELDIETLLNIKDKSDNNITTNSNNNNNNGNNSNNNNNNVTNNVQNNVNRPINITVNFGNEKLSEVFSEKEQIKVLRQRYNSPEYLIKYTHFNEKYPQFQNIVVKDDNSGKAKIYDGHKKKFVLIRKKDLYPELLDKRLDDIEEFYDNHKDKIGQTSRTSINNMLNKYRTEQEKEQEKSSKYLKDKYGKFDILCINESSTVNEN